MSDVTYNIVCTIGNGAEKMKIEEMSIDQNTKSIASVIAGEVVNEILESALDIATRATETGVHWRLIKEESCTSLYKPKSIISMEDKNVNAHIDVADSIDKTTMTIKNIQHADFKTTEPMAFDGEMEHLKAAKICEAVPAGGGVGDQPSEEKDNFVGEIVVEKPINVERKTRVIDLVKNSGQVLNEYILNDKLRPNQEEWEESEEKLIQVIDLECKELRNKNYKRQSPEDTPLPDDDDDLIEMPQDNVMDVIDLSAKAFQEEVKQVTSEIINHGGKGDEYVNCNMIVVLPPHEAVPNVEGENIIHEHASVAESKTEAKETKSKKKKWNLGARLLNFLKRHPKEGNN